jgi:hypothetical protein
MNGITYRISARVEGFYHALMKNQCFDILKSGNNFGICGFGSQFWAGWWLTYPSEKYESQWER